MYTAQEQTRKVQGVDLSNLENQHCKPCEGEVRYTTHAIGGLSENDFICAAKINQMLDT